MLSLWDSDGMDIKHVAIVLQVPGVLFIKKKPNTFILFVILMT